MYCVTCVQRLWVRISLDIYKILDGLFFIYSNATNVSRKSVKSLIDTPGLQLQCTMYIGFSAAGCH